MALRNGLLIHGPTSWAAAARDRDGEIQVASGRKPVLAPDLAVRVPLLRGPLRLAEAFLLIPTVRMKLRVGAAPVRGRAGDRRDVRRLEREPGAAPSAGERDRASWSRRRSGWRRRWSRSATATSPPTTASSTRRSAPTRPGSDDPASATKEHERCGSNLVAPMLVLSAAGQLLLERALEEPGPMARAAVGVASASLAAEMFAWSERNPETTAARAFHRPGHEIQRLIATKEPTPEQLEVGVAALREILRVEQEAEGETRRAIRSPLRRLPTPCSTGSTTSASPPTTSRAPSPSTRGPSACRWPIARRWSHRAWRRPCSTSATATSSCCGRSAPTRRSASTSSKRGPGLHHVAYAVGDIDDVLGRLKDAGVELIDDEPRVGIRDSRVAFLHPRSTGGVLTEIVEPSKAH